MKQRHQRGRSHQGVCLTAMAMALMLAGGPAGSQAPDARNLVVSLENAGPKAQQSQRLALVIGNATYKEAPLINPVNDARAIAQVLKDSGFTVMLHENLDHRGMGRAVRTFGDRLREGGGVGLFYFAGHGMQIKGRNFLIPVGAAIGREDEVAYEALDAQAVLDKMEAAGNGTNIMILDACRNNPFARSFRSSSAGLAQMDAPVGTLVAFATSPGSVASDGSGDNGLYTQHLLSAMRRPGSKVEDVFKQVRANVRRDSQGKQVPWESTSLEGDFFFLAPAPVVAALPPPPPIAPPAPAVDAQRALDDALWQLVQNSNQAVDLKAYLSRFPNGVHAPQARARLIQLEASALAAAPPVTAPTAAPAPAITSAASAPALPPRVEMQASRPAPLASLPSPSSTGQPLALAPPPSSAVVPSAAPAPAATMHQVTRPAGSSPSQAESPSTTQRVAHAPLVGDRWRVQVVDKYKGEVVNNYSRKVDSALPTGDLVINSNSLVTDSMGNLKSSRAVGVTKNQVWEPANVLVPQELREGYVQSVKFNYKATRVRDNSDYEEIYEGKLEVKGRESIKVPAGEFVAWRIERVLTVNGKNLGAPGSWFGRNSTVIWYSPEVRGIVAMDWEHRIGNGAPDRFRHELTSYEAVPSNLAQR